MGGSTHVFPVGLVAEQGCALVTAATGAREVARVVPDGGAGFVDVAVERGIGEMQAKDCRRPG